MTAKIVINSNEQITCPHCEEQFALKDAIAHQLIEEHEGEYQKMIQHELVSIRETAIKEAEKQASKSFNKTIAALTEQLNDSKESEKSFQLQITSEKKKAEQRVRESMALETQALQESLEAKDEQLTQFRKQELALRKDKLALEDKEKSLELELVRRVESEKESLKATIEEQFKLKEAELRKKIVDAVT
jgi:hypothetical protein